MMNLFEINKILDNEVYVYLNTPIVDNDVSDSLRNKLWELYDNGIINITISFKNVNEIGSSGIGKLLLFHKKLGDAGGNLRIIDLNEEIKKLIKYLRLDLLFETD